MKFRELSRINSTLKQLDLNNQHDVQTGLQSLQNVSEGLLDEIREVVREFFDPMRFALYLIIGPGEQSVREALFQYATDHQAVFQGVGNRRLAEQYTTVFKRTILNPTDYEHHNIDVLTSKVLTVWQGFLSEDLPQLRIIMNEIAWPEMAPSSI